MFHFLQIGAELPVDSDDAERENKNDNGSTLLCVFERGCTPSRSPTCSCNIQCSDSLADFNLQRLHRRQYLGW